MFAQRVLIDADSEDPTFLARANQAARLPHLFRAGVPAALAVFIVLSVTSVGSAAGLGDAPAWYLGEWWNYEGTVWAPGPVERFSANVSVVDLSAEAARVRAELSYGFGTVVQDTDVALPSFRVVAFDASFPSGIQHRFDYEAPLELFSFPLTTGKTWSSASTFDYSYRTLTPAKVSTPAGTFDAFPVEQNAMGIPFITVEFILPDLGYAVIYYSGVVGQIVRYEAFSLIGELVAEFSITNYSIPAGPARSEVGPGIGWGAEIVAALLLGMSGAAAVQVLRTVGRRSRA